MQKQFKPYTQMAIKPPVFEPITPIKVSERWFPKGQRFGLYECGGRIESPSELPGLEMNNYLELSLLISA